ncbi:RHS Repeat protein [compost metagenome]
MRTRFDGGTLDARYQFDNELDPAQLTGFEIRGLEDSPLIVALEYDLDGNLVLDEQGRTLAYDALGRLQSVNGAAGTASANYAYDPLDRLAMQETL